MREKYCVVCKKRHANVCKKAEKRRAFAALMGMIGTSKVPAQPTKK
jgi:hypothetical protein